MEDQGLIIYRFSLQRRVLSLTLQAQTAGGQTLSVVDPPWQPRHLQRLPGNKGERNLKPFYLEFLVEREYCKVLVSLGLTYTSTVTGICWPGTRQSCRRSQAKLNHPAPVLPSCLLVGFVASASHLWQRAGGWTGPAAAELSTPETQHTLDSEKANLTRFLTSC